MLGSVRISVACRPVARIALGGLCFTFHSDGISFLPETDESYRQFLLDPTAPDSGDTIDVRVSVAPVRQPTGRLLFDSGSWRIYDQGDARSLVLGPPTLQESLCEIRFRPGLRQVEMVCTPRLLESRGGVTGIRNPFLYPLDQVLTMYLLGARGLIVHAAGFDILDRGVALPGVSGAGKSTITRLARELPGARALSDDRVILRMQNDEVAMHGTPWPGEAGVAEHHHVRAGHLLFLEKGDHNGVRPIPPREALARLLPTASLPWFDAAHLESGLRACDGIVRAVPAGVFTFREETRAVEVLETYLAEHVVRPDETAPVRAARGKARLT